MTFCYCKIFGTQTYFSFLDFYVRKNIISSYFFFFNCITETRNWNNNFGASLLLANSPMSPKVVNGSFAALFDNGDNWSQKLLRSEMKDSSCK